MTLASKKFIEVVRNQVPALSNECYFNFENLNLNHQIRIYGKVYVDCARRSKEDWTIHTGRAICKISGYVALDQINNRCRSVHHGTTIVCVGKICFAK